MRGVFVLSVVGLLAVSGGAFAQSFNIEFGEAGSAPSSSYAAAGLLGDAMTSLNNPLDVCIFFEGMDNGDYEILKYAITPGQGLAGRTTCGVTALR